MKNSSVIIDQGTDDQLLCTGYRSCTSKTVLYYTCNLLSLGCLFLMFHWKKIWSVKCRMTLCSLSEAEVVLVTNIYTQSEIAVVHSMSIDCPSNAKGGIISDIATDSSNEDTTALLSPCQEEVPQQVVRYFVYGYLRYLWSVEDGSFTLLTGLERNTTCEMLHNDYLGISSEHRSYMLNIHGNNSIDIEQKSYLKLFVEEVFNPFYMFQICSVLLWCLDQYYIYSACIVLISTLSLVVSLYETKKQSKTLHDMVSSHNIETFQVYSMNKYSTITIAANQLVCGDLMILPGNGFTMPCDAVLINGNAIVNESMLTGESVPVTKTPVSPSEADEIYHQVEHRRHTLFSGTRVIQTRFYGKNNVVAVVTKTGFNTAKGELVRSILNPRPVGLKFYKDALKFIGFLTVVAAMGMGYSAYNFIRNKAPVKTIFLRVLDIITVVVPPALPAAMTVGTVYAQGRLKKFGVFCICPSRINVCGKLKLFCFDKTGTLTEDGLNIWGALPCIIIPEPATSVDVKDEIDRGSETSAKEHLVTLKSTCGHQDLKTPRDTLKRGVAYFSRSTENCELRAGDVFQTSKFSSSSSSFSTSTSSSSSSIVVDSAETSKKRYDPSRLSDRCPLKIAMASCHSLTIIDGELTGDPLDLTMFQSVKWILEEPGDEAQRFDTLIATVVRPVTSNPRLSYSNLQTAVDNGSTCNIEIGIVRQFTFSSQLQRMSVITRELGANAMQFYVKGAPEAVAKLCNPDSVPPDFNQHLYKYTQKGYRVIAFAYKTLDIKINWVQAHKIKREDLEYGLNFLGLLIMENTLKKETLPVIEKLKIADIRTVMVTGDNILTAISVAKQCSMISSKDKIILVSASPAKVQANMTIKASITYTYVEDNKISQEKETRMEQLELQESNRNYDSSIINVDTSNFHFAIDGHSFAVLFNSFPDLIDKICAKGTIFARMSPDQKTLLVESLQNLGYTVGMCGDGANDCGALKAADAGISLSEAEASVSSHFTSKSTNILCVPTVIREGRAALVTSFGVFKYMALYSLIQFISLLILYTELCNLGDWMFLYIDLLITTTVAILMGHTDAYHSLSKRRPAGSLVSPANIIGILLHVTSVACVQVFAFYWLTQQEWYKPASSINPHSSSIVFSYETSAIFTVSSFQYLILAYTFSKGPPYRQSIVKNKMFLFSLVIIMLATIVISLIYIPIISNLLQIKQFPNFNFSLSLIAISFANFILSIFLESVILESSIYKNTIKFFRNKKTTKNKYKKILRSIDEDISWPPIGN